MNTTVLSLSEVTRAVDLQQDRPQSPDRKLQCLWEAFGRAQRDGLEAIIKTDEGIFVSEFSPPRPCVCATEFEVKATEDEGIARRYEANLETTSRVVEIIATSTEGTFMLKPASQFPQRTHADPGNVTTRTGRNLQIYSV